MNPQNLNDLFLEQLKDAYSAENQILDALPKMADKANSSKLKQAFELHLKQTEKQVERLEEIFDQLNESADGHTCKAMKGIIAEGEEFMKKDPAADVLDAGLIAAAQKVEHYEIATYGTLCTYAQILGKNRAADLLNQTLDEEKNTDMKLTDIAESTINTRAAHA